MTSKISSIWRLFLVILLLFIVYILASKLFLLENYISYIFIVIVLVAILPDIILEIKNLRTPTFITPIKTKYWPYWYSLFAISLVLINLFIINETELKYLELNTNQFLSLFLIILISIKRNSYYQFTDCYFQIKANFFERKKDKIYWNKNKTITFFKKSILIKYDTGNIRIRFKTINKDDAKIIENYIKTISKKYKIEIIEMRNNK